MGVANGLSSFLWHVIQTRCGSLIPKRGRGTAVSPVHLLQILLPQLRQ